MALAFSLKTQQALNDGLASKLAAVEITNNILTQNPNQTLLPSGSLMIGNSLGQGQASPLNLDGLDAKRTLRATYNFAVNGGAIGSIPLSQVSLPAKAIITKVLVDVITAPTSGGSATVGLQILTADDLLAATAIASLTVGLHDGVPANTAATSIKNGSSALPINVEIATAALTAGEFVVFVEYMISQ